MGIFTEVLYPNLPHQYHQDYHHHSSKSHKKYPWLLDWSSRFSKITFSQQETGQDEYGIIKIMIIYKRNMIMVLYKRRCSTMFSRFEDCHSISSTSPRSFDSFLIRVILY